MRHISHVNLEIEGRVSAACLKQLIALMDKELGLKAKLCDEEALIDLNTSEWSKDVRASMISGDYVRIYRENAGWNQTELGKKLGAFTKQYISDIENGRREISKELAKKLSQVFKVPVDRFL